MKKYKKVLLSFMLVLTTLFSCLFNITSASPVSATIIGSNKYTDVLEDLETDITFDSNNYPVDTSNNSLQVITLSESSDKELFVYVYQPNSPNADLTATSINISLSDSAISYNNYQLIKLNENGVFAKYKVIGIKVSSDSTRYYDVSSIYRKWNEKYDTEVQGNVISEIAMKVAKQFVFQTKGNQVVSDSKDIEVITITDKYVGFVRYAGDNAPDWIADGFFYANDVDRHFVAFSTDKKIDKLMEADVYYSKQHKNGASYSEIERGIIAKLDYTQKAEESGNTTLGSLIFGKNTYSWNRIQSVDEFVKENTDLSKVYSNGVFNAESQSNLTEQGKEDLKNKEWVLSFYESEHRIYKKCVPFGTGATCIDMYLEEYDIVSEVTILRLAFETDGVRYNLGVVDNKQMGDGIPDNYVEKSLELTDMFKIILALILIIFLYIILGPVLPIIFGVIKAILKLLWKCIKFIFKLICNIISFPFKFMGDGFK